ncbi:hypothetical protein MP638_005274 [Amoeboaphelidium occidentale]|nr:hypothetical protein MP638_005274 [Amoeboaphelidium occidentale]
MNKNKRFKRVWVDGCFDLTHFGHFNALRQAKDLCEFLVVGVHSDEEIERNKGKPVLTMKERVGILEACSFVDQVVPNAPYYTSIEWLDRFQCEVCVHGDDVTTTADGTDCYAEVKLCKRYVECKRTIGISTTDLVQRVLSSSSSSSSGGGLNDSNSDDDVMMMMYSVERIIDFGLHKRLNNKKDDLPMVLCVGVFDVFNYSHVELLQKVKENNSGLKVVIGLLHYTEENNNNNNNKTKKKKTLLLLGLYERLLCLLSCKYVDDVVVISVKKDSSEQQNKRLSLSLSEEFVESVEKIVVCKGDGEDIVISVKKDSSEQQNKRLSLSLTEEFVESVEKIVVCKGDGEDSCLDVVENLDKIKIEQVEVSKEFNTQSIVDRILGNRKLYEDRNRRKMEKQKLEKEMEGKEKEKRK